MGGHHPLGVVVRRKAVCGDIKVKVMGECIMEPSERTGFLILRVRTKKCVPSVLEVSVLFETEVSIRSILPRRTELTDSGSTLISRLNPTLVAADSLNSNGECGPLSLAFSYRSSRSPPRSTPSVKALVCSALKRESSCHMRTKASLACDLY